MGKTLVLVRAQRTRPRVVEGATGAPGIGARSKANPRPDGAKRAFWYVAANRIHLKKLPYNEIRQGAGERRAGGGAKPSAEPVG